jgi:hypothetical protein
VRGLRVGAQVLNNIARIRPVIDESELEIYRVDAMELQNIFMGQAFPNDDVLPQTLRGLSGNGSDVHHIRPAHLLSSV